MSGRKNRLLATSLAGVCVAALVGAVLGATGSQMYLVILFPAAAGLGTGWAIGSVASGLKVHWPREVGIIGAVCGALAMISMLVVVAQVEHASALAELSQEKSAWGPEQIRTQAARAVTLMAGGHEGILQPLFLRLHSGVVLFGSAPLSLGTIGNGSLLAIEVVTCVFLGFRFARRAASIPFCERCDHWYARRVLGSAPLGSLASIRAAMQNRQFHRLGRRLGGPTTTGAVMLHGRFCDTCDSGDVHLELEVSESGGRPRLLKTMVEPHDALDAILDSHALKTG